MHTTWNSRFIRKDPDTGEDLRQKKKREAGDEMAGSHHQLNGHELGHTTGDSERQGGLECCNPLDRKESGMT